MKAPVWVWPHRRWYMPRIAPIKIKIKIVLKIDIVIQIKIRIFRDASFFRCARVEDLDPLILVCDDYSR